MDRTQLCIICKNQFCQENYDHESITAYQFQRLFNSQAKINIFITDIRNKVNRTFATLQKKTLIQLDGRQRCVLTQIDLLQYWHLLKPLGSMKNIEAILFGFSLPKNKLTQLVRVFKKEYKSNTIFPSFRSLQKELNFVLSSQFSIQQFGTPQEYLFQKFGKIIHEFQNTQLKKGKHIAAGYQNPHREFRNPEFSSSTQCVLIEGIPMSIQKETLNLSMLQINDQLLMKYIPAIQKMLSLKQVELRNNKISSFGYSILINSIPNQNIHTLDLRNSKLSIKTVQEISEKMINIENLYISQTGIQNRHLDMIGSCLKKLKLLHTDKNPITHESVQRLIQEKPNLIYISVKNTNMSLKQGKQLVRKALRINKCIQIN